MEERQMPSSSSIMGTIKIIAKNGAPFSKPEITHWGRIKAAAKTTGMTYAKSPCLKSNILPSQFLIPVTRLCFFSARKEAMVGDHPLNRKGTYNNLLSFNDIPIQLHMTQVPQPKSNIRNVYPKCISQIIPAQSV